MSRHSRRKSHDWRPSRNRHEDERTSRSRRDASPTLESSRHSKHTSSVLSPRSSRKSRGGRRRSQDSDGAYNSSGRHRSGKSSRRKSGRSPSYSRSPSPTQRPRSDMNRLESHSESPSPPSKARRHKSDGYRESRRDRRRSHYAGDDDSVGLEEDDYDRDDYDRDRRRHRNHNSSRRSGTSSRRHRSRRSHSGSPSRRRRRSRRDHGRSRASEHYDRDREDGDDDRRYYDEKENERQRPSGRSRRDRRRRNSSSSYSIEDEHDRRRNRSPKRSGAGSSRRRRRSHRRPKRRHSSSPSVPSERDERQRHESPMEVAPRAGVVSEDEEVHPSPPAETAKKQEVSKTDDKSKDKSKEKSKRSASQHNDEVGHYQGGKGSVLNEKYSVIGEVGVGTFGRVLECNDLSQSDQHRKQRRRPQQNDTVAIKVVRNIKRYYKSARIEADILADVNRKGGRGLSHCVIMHEAFSFDGHYCMVFESLGSSLYDFMKRQRYQPYPPDLVYDFAKQMLETLEFIHSFKLIHTDLKPENILLMNDREVKHNGYWVPESTRIKIIDFGGATYDNEKKSSIVNTRQYRAPEVLLGTGWSMESDMWSAGCILAELYQGELLFATHDNVEHLALIERVIDRFPRWMIERGKQEDLIHEAFHSDGTHKMDRVLEPESISYVKRVKPLESIVYPEDAWFLSMLRRILVIDPNRRSTARECLNNSKQWTR